MVLFPHAKINLGLNVVARRPDGYHDIESILVPIPLHDVLEAVIAPELGANGLEFTRTGSPIAGSVEDDLCHKAVRLIQDLRPLPGLKMHLHKVIPMGAGLGGGSSDGAHTLLLVNEVCGSGLAPGLLRDLAAQLGSDCPFFLEKGPQFVHGRGELMEGIDLDLKDIWLVLLNPGTHVSTAEVYRNTKPTGRRWNLQDLLSRERRGDWNDRLRNTMEPYVTATYPEVEELKHLLRAGGAFHAAMSGSGSSVFGLFTRPPGDLPLPAGTRAWTLRL